MGFPRNWMTKAHQAAASARVLLDIGDTSGACNRAYYAMLHAARDALLASDVLIEPKITERHGAIISAFSLHFVKTGRVPEELGKAIDKVGNIRSVADHEGGTIKEEDAGWAVKQAEEFVHAIISTFTTKPPESNHDIKISL